MLRKYVNVIKRVSTKKKRHRKIKIEEDLRIILTCSAICHTLYDKEVGRMRVNARLDSSHEEKVKYIIDQTHESVTEVLKKAIDFYHQYVKKNKQPNSNIIFRSGFIGSGKGPEHLSSHYKTELIKSLKTKWS